MFLAAVLVKQDDVSLLFSYTRSYFFVEANRPSELVSFIKTIIPRKPTAEVYISIGYNKHGKTELYRHALRHLARSSDKYELARGLRGMVMIVFTMPSYPVVFKIIKDGLTIPSTHRGKPSSTGITCFPARSRRSFDRRPRVRVSNTRSRSIQRRFAGRALGRG